MSTDASSTRRLLSVVVLCSIVLIAPSAFAQSGEDSREAAEITSRQVELNEEGVRAIINGDHQKAIAVLSESLAYGEANATYLNLGRAYQKLGNCEEAIEALEKALTAPVVDDPPPRVIDKKARQYLAELDEDCPVEEPAEDPQEVDQDDVSDQDTAPTGQDLTEPGPDNDTGGSNAPGWAALAGGVAIGAGGVVMHVLAQQERNDVWTAGFAEGSDRVRDVSLQEAEDARQKANTFNTIGLSANIVGGVLAGVGTYLLLTGNSSESAALDLQVGPDRATAVFKWRF